MDVLQTAVTLINDVKSKWDAATPEQKANILNQAEFIVSELPEIGVYVTPWIEKNKALITAVATAA